MSDSPEVVNRHPQRGAIGEPTRAARLVSALAELTNGVPLASADEIESALIEQNERQKVQCDYCTASFVPDLMTTPVDGGGEYMRFLCPHCQSEYPVAVVTSHGVRLRERMITVERIIGRDDGDIDKWMKELNNIKAQYAREVKKGMRPSAPA